MNVSTTKKMIVDFRKNPTVFSPVIINDQSVEVVQEYKYLGTVLDHKLTFESQVDAICKKAHQRMYFYRKLSSFKVDNTFMRMFYSCFIESVLTFAFITWYGMLTLKNRNRLQGITKVCSRIAGTTLNDLTMLYQRQTLKKAQSVLDDQSHPLHAEFRLLPSGRRYCVPKCRTNRMRNSLVPAAIVLLNNSL